MRPAANGGLEPILPDAADRISVRFAEAGGGYIETDRLFQAQFGRIEPHEGQPHGRPQDQHN